MNKDYSGDPLTLVVETKKVNIIIKKRKLQHLKNEIRQTRTTLLTHKIEINQINSIEISKYNTNIAIPRRYY